MFKVTTSVQLYRYAILAQCHMVSSCLHILYRRCVHLWIQHMYIEGKCTIFACGGLASLCHNNSTRLKCQIRTHSYSTCIKLYKTMQCIVHVNMISNNVADTTLGKKHHRNFTSRKWMWHMLKILFSPYFEVHVNLSYTKHTYIYWHDIYFEKCSWCIMPLFSVQFWVHFILWCLLTQWIQGCVVYHMYLVFSVSIAANIFIMSHTVIRVHVNSMSSIEVFWFWLLELNLFIWLWPLLGLHRTIMGSQ